LDKNFFETKNLKLFRTDEKYKIHFPLIHRAHQCPRNHYLRTMLPMVARKLSVDQKARTHQKIRAIHHRKCAERLVPQINIVGQATYQNDVTQFPIKLPNISVDPLSKDQYKVYADISQTIYDGGNIKNQKKLAQAQSEIQSNKLK
jgi:hypothetical protein